MKTKKNVYFVTHAAVIAAIYVVLTMLLAPFSFGPIQFRISEALCILPYFTPAAVPGVFIGCLLSNFLAGAEMLDVIFGSLATLLGAFGTYFLRKRQLLACLPPIVSNMLIIPWVLRFAYGIPDLIPLLMLTIGIGEILAVGILGNLLMIALERYKHLLFGTYFS